jgi:hypothetical protein
MDQSTVLINELGHVTGLDSIYVESAHDDLMYAWPTTGERRLVARAACPKHVDGPLPATLLPNHTSAGAPMPRCQSKGRERTHLRRDREAVIK